MGRFRSEGNKIPKHVRVLQVGCRVPLLGMNKTGEQDRVPDEKDGGVVTHQVPVTLLRVEFDRKASRVTGSVS